MKGRRIGWAVGLAASVAVCGAEERPPVKKTDLYRARSLAVFSRTVELGQERRGRPWDFHTKEGCNVTYLSPEIRDVSFGPGGLCFTASAEDVLLGWGNYDNLQPKAERIPMFPGWNIIEVDVRQTGTSSVWRLQLWMDGSPKFDRNSSRHEYGGLPWDAVKGGDVEATATGTNRQTLRFRAFRGQPDGFSLRVSGPAGNRVTVDGLRITHVQKGGVYRRAFSLPAGRTVWRAVGEVTSGRLFVNGREVDYYPDLLKDKGAVTYPVDLAPYLTPGEAHVLALDSAGSSTVYFQGRVVLDDGSEMLLDTGPDWIGAMEPEPGWNTTAYAAAGWTAPKTSDAYVEIFIRRWPVYDGRLLLERPGSDPALYMNDAEAVRVHARIPGGWAGVRPEAAWTLRRVDRDNARPIAAQGRVAPDRAVARDGSLVYELDAGRHPQGVYTLEVSLEAGGQTVERRFEEPLIVVGRLDMPEVAGDAYDEGMELELEDTLDFTDPDDPHRWIEVAAPQSLKGGSAGRDITEPRLVETNGLVYREVTDSKGAAMFSYRFTFQRPYGWYLMALDYPNDAERWIGVSVSCGSEPGPGPRAGSSECGPSVVTGVKFPLDRRMHELRWLHWADAQPHTLDIVNLGGGAPAAAARARLYRVVTMPAMRVGPRGGRLFGIHTERAHSLGRTYGDTTGVDFYQGTYDKRGYDMVARFTQRLRWAAEAARNYTAYLRFTGQNAHVMGAFQYNEANMAYVPPERVPGDGRLLQDIRDVALRYFDANGVVMYSLVEYIGHRALQGRFSPSDAEVGAGADTLAFVSREGRQGGWNVNPNHPLSEMGYLRIADDLAVKFAKTPAWQGVFYNVSGEGSFGPAPCSPAVEPLLYDYSDATLARFEQDTGIRVPGRPGDPARFRQRYLFLTSDALRDTWIEWRGRAMGSYLTKTRDLLRRYRPDLNVLCGWHLTTPAIQQWTAVVGGDYGAYARQLAVVPALLRDEPGIWIGRTLYPVGSSHGRRSPAMWAHNVDPSVLAYYDVPNRMVVLNTCWHELTTRPGAAAADWPTGPFAARFISQASEDYALESFTQALIGADPDVLLFGFTDVNLINSREQQVREVAKTITALPREKFESVLGTADFRHNLAIRARRQGTDLWFYVANPGYWPIRGEVVLSGRAAVARAHDGRPIETREESGRTVVPVDLRPYGLAAFQAGESGAGTRAPNLEIVSWTNAPVAEPDLAHMRAILREVRALLDDPDSALALPPRDRDMMAAACAEADSSLAVGRIAEAWSALTHWRFWTLWKQVLAPARTQAARLRAAADPNEDWNAGERPGLTVARVAGEPPVIDGVLDDPAWKGARPSGRFLAIGSGGVLPGRPLMDTAVQAAYDAQRLYVALRMADPDVTALKRDAAPDRPIEVLRKYDDAVLLFLNTDKDQVRQFAVNAGGVRYMARSGAWSVDDTDVQTAGWSAAATAQPGEWVVEAAIPFALLEADPPAAGRVWRANFLRRFREFGKVPEFYWAQVSAWENTAHYGTLTFQ